MSDRPNLVVFVPDQLRADAVGCFGNPVAHTPNIDAFAASGTRFTQAFGQHPFCSPSRVSFLTGWYPHVHGHRTLTSLLKPWQPDAFQVLKEAGYHVAHAGLRGDTWSTGRTQASTSRFGWHVAPTRLWNPSPFGPDHRYGRAFYHGLRPESFVDFDEAAVQTAEHWLAEGLPEPFVLYLPLIFPHPPFEVEEPWYSMHDRSEVPAPGPVVDGPEAPFKQRIRETYGMDRMSPDDWAEVIATYYGMVSRIDHQFGRVLRALEVAGVEDRSAVFFFTDHGEYLGDQGGLVEKWISGVDASLLHNPLIARVPGMPEGVVADGMTELIDLPATWAELGEVELPYHQFGESLVPALSGDTPAGRDAAFSVAGLGLRDRRVLAQRFPYDLKNQIESEHPEVAERVVAMRTEQWTYVQRHGGPDELYDRRADPGETVNLVDHADRALVLGELRRQVGEWLIDTSDVLPFEPDPRLDTEGALTPA